MITCTASRGRQRRAASNRYRLPSRLGRTLPAHPHTRAPYSVGGRGHPALWAKLTRPEPSSVDAAPRCRRSPRVTRMLNRYNTADTRPATPGRLRAPNALISRSTRRATAPSRFCRKSNNTLPCDSATGYRKPPPGDARQTTPELPICSPCADQCRSAGRAADASRRCPATNSGAIAAKGMTTRKSSEPPIEYVLDHDAARP